MNGRHAVHALTRYSMPHRRSRTLRHQADVPLVQSANGLGWHGEKKPPRKPLPDRSGSTEPCTLIRSACWLRCRPIQKTRCPVVYNNDTMEPRIRYAQTADGRDAEAAPRMHTSPGATCAHSPSSPLFPGHRPRSRRNVGDITKRCRVLVRLKDRGTARDSDSTDRAREGTAC